jgi:hypothetical protein
MDHASGQVDSSLSVACLPPSDAEAVKRLGWYVVGAAGFEPATLACKLCAPRPALSAHVSEHRTERRCSAAAPGSRRWVTPPGPRREQQPAQEIRPRGNSDDRRGPTDVPAHSVVEAERLDHRAKPALDLGR